MLEYTCGAEFDRPAAPRHAAPPRWSRPVNCATLSHMKDRPADWFQANLALLPPGLRAAIERVDAGALPDDAAGRIRVDGPSPGLEASIRTSDGRWVRLHSQRDPIAEAERLLDAVQLEPRPPLVVVIGLGLGYVLDALDRHVPSSTVLALEPTPSAIKPFLARRDWRDWLGSGRLTILIGPEYQGHTGAWQLVDPGAQAPPIVVSPVIGREFGADVARARNVANQVVYGAKANQEAQRQFAGRYLLNTIENLPVIEESADVRSFYGAFAGVPAIVVSAGPSLDRNLVDLAAVGDRALIIAADTAVRPLLGADISPHLAVSIDPSELNGRHLRDLPDPVGTWLVAEGSIDPAAFRQFTGRIFVFQVSDHHPWPWLATQGLTRGKLRAWGSVATTAFDLALQAGCDPIVFAGQDLAYTGGRPYCRGTTFETNWARSVASGAELPDLWARHIAPAKGLQAPDLHGVPTLTAPQLLAFRDWLLEQCQANPSRSFINATGAGCLAGPAVRQVPLTEVVQRLPMAAGVRRRIADLGRASAPGSATRSAASHTA